MSGPDGASAFYRITGADTSTAAGSYRARFFNFLSFPVTARIRAQFDRPGQFDPLPFLRTRTKPDIQVNDGDQITCGPLVDCDFAVTPDLLSGQVLFDPPQLLRARDIEFQGPLGSVARAELGALGEYATPLSENSWDEYRLRLTFEIENNNFISTHLGRLRPLTPPIDATGTFTALQRDFVEGNALVKVFMAVADGSPLSNPRLDATLGAPVLESARGIANGQTNVAIGEARMVLLAPAPEPYNITASAIVNGSRADFGSFSVDPEPGDVIVVGIGPRGELSLTIREPSDGDLFAEGEDIPLSFLASDDTAIDRVTISGPFPSIVVFGDPGNPQDLSFTGNLAGGLPDGIHTLVFTARDGDGNEVSDALDIVVDGQPPAIISAAPSSACLWPPNHKMVPIDILVELLDAVDPDPSCRISDVTSNEHLNGLGDGNTSFDWEVTGPLSVDLRAERTGLGNGRVYTISLECSDKSGNTSGTEVEVCVPHDQGGGRSAKRGK